MSTHRCTYTYIWTHPRLCMYAYICVLVRDCVRGCAWMSLRGCVCSSVCASVCLKFCVHAPRAKKCGPCEAAATLLQVPPKCARVKVRKRQNDHANTWTQAHIPDSRATGQNFPSQAETTAKGQQAASWWACYDQSLLIHQAYVSIHRVNRVHVLTLYWVTLKLIGSTESVDKAQSQASSHLTLSPLHYVFIDVAFITPYEIIQ